MFYPPKGLRKQNRRWSNCFYFPFYCVLETVLTLSKSEPEIGLFEILKMFYPPKGLRKQNRRWSNCFYFPFYCVLETVLTLSKSELSIGLFEILFTDVMVWDGMSGGGTEYQKCPSILFILCSYVELVFIYFNIYSKIETNIIISF